MAPEEKNTVTLIIANISADTSKPLTVEEITEAYLEPSRTSAVEIFLRKND